MLEELQRRNYSPSTIRGYLLAVEQFAKHFGKSPDKLGPDELRSYQAYLLTERKLAVGSVVARVAALRFFFVRALKRREFREELPYPKDRRRLPTVLSLDEVTRLIDAAGNLMRGVLPKPSSEIASPAETRIEFQANAFRTLEDGVRRGGGFRHSQYRNKPHAPERSVWVPYRHSPPLSASLLCRVLYGFLGGFLSHRFRSRLLRTLLSHSLLGRNFFRCCLCGRLRGCRFGGFLCLGLLRSLFHRFLDGCLLQNLCHGSHSLADCGFDGAHNVLRHCKSEPNCHPGLIHDTFLSHSQLPQSWCSFAVRNC